MKNKLKTPYILFLGTVITTIIGILLYSTIKMYHEIHRQISDEILIYSNLNQLNLKLNQDTLMAFHSKVYHYDIISKDQQNLKKFITRTPSFKKNILNKDKLISKFKMHNSTYRNSFYFLGKKVSENKTNYPFKNELSKLLIQDINSIDFVEKIEELSRKISKHLQNKSSSKFSSFLNHIMTHLGILKTSKIVLNKVIRSIQRDNLTQALEKKVKELEEIFHLNSKQFIKLSYFFFITCFLSIAIVLLGLKKIMNFNKILKSEVELKTKHLIKAKKEAEVASEMKGQFMAKMGHEIRTPLNGVLGCANILLDNAEKPENINLLKTITSCGDSLLTLINDILDYSKLESGKQDLENINFNLKDSINQVIQLFNSMAIDQSILLSQEFHPDTPEWIIGDETRLRQILNNLISNAIKFTKKGNVKIEISAQQIEQDNLELRFAVMDTGIGIQAKDREKLFQSFSQADESISRKFGGTGLGLAICKSTVELMNGNIWLDKEYENGSKFIFTIRCKKGHSIKTSQTVEDKPLDNILAEKIPLKILLVDDNRINQLVGGKMLEKLGYRADMAASGQEAIDALKIKNYDLIFMDCHMPEMDGLETTKYIIQNWPKEKCPYIVALTASTLKEDQDRCYAAGMNDFISKPIKIEDIKKTINDLKE